MKIYGRVKSSVSLLSSLQPATHLGGVTLDNVRTASIEVRKEMLKKLLSPEIDISNVPEYLILYTLVLDYWCQKEKVSLVEIHSVLLCHFALAQIDPKTGAVRNSKKLAMLALEDVSVDKKYFLAASKL